MTWHTGSYAKMSTKWYVWSDKQAMIADWLSRSVYFDENYLFIPSKATDSNTNHNQKQWKSMHGQQLFIWTGRYTITDYRHIQFILKFFL